jgi:hypothetical protein
MVAVLAAKPDNGAVGARLVFGANVLLERKHETDRHADCRA